MPDGGAGLERIAASAGYADCFVFGMDVGFHGNLVIVLAESMRIQSMPAPRLAHELPSKYQNSMPTTWGPRIICGCAAVDKISCRSRCTRGQYAAKIHAHVT
jgi:hypothetical protein